MKILYNEKDYELKWSMTAMKLFEDIMQRPFKGASLKDYTVMLYVLLVTAERGNKNLPPEPFYNWTTEHPEMLQKFINWVDSLC